MITGLNPQEIEKLLFGYELLSPNEKMVADRHLSNHPALASRLGRVLQKEVAARVKIPTDGEFWHPEKLRPEDKEAQRDSLRQILAKVFLPPSRRSSTWFPSGIPLTPENM